MNEEVWRVKDLIKYLADFNPNAIIENKLDIGWSCYGGADTMGMRDIEKEKADADSVTLYSHLNMEFEKND